MAGMVDFRALTDFSDKKYHTNVYKAVRNGDWDNPNTWDKGRVPTANARVEIPDNITVTYDHVSNTRIFAISVDGTLRFSPTKNTKLVVDTVVVHKDAALQIGTVDNPIRSNVDTEIVIADYGSVVPKQGRATLPGVSATRLEWDPQQITRGIIAEGDVEMHGAAKTSHLKVADDPMRGDKTITLKEAPVGWQVGDTIVVASAYFPKNGTERAHPDQNEERVITAINGSRITLNDALDYNHDAPANAAGVDFAVDVANLSRNITISSQDAAQIGARGHVMIRHEGQGDLRFVAFDELGRTDKSYDLDDYRTVSAEGYDDFRLRAGTDGGQVRKPEEHEAVPTPPAQIDNQRGRYPLHFHHSEETNFVQGVVVDGAPGWGLTQHDSAAFIGDSIVYEAYGSGFVTETGNETGKWWGNLALDIDGRRLGDDEVAAEEKSGGYNQDTGVGGAGYWLQGRLIELEDNIAANTAHAGFFFFSRGIDNQDLTLDQLRFPQTARGEPGGDPDPRTTDPDHPAILLFENNEAYGTRNGVQIIGDGSRKLNDERSYWSDFVGWELAETGVVFQYSSKYTFDDFVLIGAREGGAIGDDKGRHGFRAGTTTQDTVVVDAHIEDFGTAVYTNKGISDSKRRSDFYIDPGKDVGLVIVGGDYDDVSRPYGDESVSPRTDTIINSNQTRPGRFEIQFQDSSLRAVKNLFVGQDTVGDRDKTFINGFVIQGTKTDGVGSIPIRFANELLPRTEADINQHMVREGYYRLKNGDRAIVMSEVFSDRLTGQHYEVEYLATLAGNWNMPRNANDLGAFRPAEHRDVYLPGPVAKLYGVNSTPKEVPIEPRVTDRMPRETRLSDNEPAPAPLPEPRESPEPRDAQDAPTPIAQPTPIPSPSNAPSPGGSNTNGTPRADILSGGADPDRIDGRDGADLISGYAGDDTLLGGQGADTLYGGGQRDLLNGGDQNDILYGQGGSDILIGGARRDVLYGGDGNDDLDGGDNNDRLYGDAGADIIDGGEGLDALFGREGDDFLFGEDNSDTLQGGAGRDQLEGGRSNDFLTGGAAVDLFVFADRNFGSDVITDFQNGYDKIVFDRDATGVRRYSDLIINERDGDVIIRSDAGMIRLENENFAFIGQEDFIFA